MFCGEIVMWPILAVWPVWHSILANMRIGRILDLFDRADEVGYESARALRTSQNLMAITGAVIFVGGLLLICREIDRIFDA